MIDVCLCMSRVRRAALACALSLIVSGVAAAQGPPIRRVLVMPFAVDADSAAPGAAGAAIWLGEAAAILLGDELNRVGLDALTRDERVTAFDRLQLPLSPTLTRATVFRVGELIGASEVVFGDVQLGGSLSIHARVIRIRAGDELTEIDAEAPSEELFALATRVARRIAVEVGQTAPEADAPAPHPSLEAFENYVKGLVAATPAAQARFLETALQEAPADDQILTSLWAVYTSQGQHEKALEAATRVPADSPVSRKARFDAALSLIDLGRYDQAFDRLRQLADEQASPVLTNALGVIQVRRGSTPQTGVPAYYFERAVNADPTNTDYLFNLGYAYALAHDPQGATYWLRETVRYDAANADAHLVMSAMLQASGKPVEARRELDLARQLGAGPDPSALTLTDRVPKGLERLVTDLDLSLSNDLDLALADPAQRDQRDAAAFQLEQGRRLFAAQQDREAMNALRRAVYLSPYEEEPHRLIGKLLQRAGRVDAAIDEFKVALWCQETLEGHLALGEALLTAGEREAARREAQRALALRPESTEAAALLARIGG